MKTQEYESTNQLADRVLAGLGNLRRTYQAIDIEAERRKADEAFARGKAAANVTERMLREGNERLRALDKSLKEQLRAVNRIGYGLDKKFKELDAEFEKLRKDGYSDPLPKRITDRSSYD